MSQTDVPNESAEKPIEHSRYAAQREIQAYIREVFGPEIEKARANRIERQRWARLSFAEKCKEAWKKKSWGPYLTTPGSP